MAKQPAPGEWTYTVGEVPVQLTAYERKDKGNRIYSRVWDGQRVTGKKVLCGAIRTARGKIDSELEQEARRLAMERQKALLSGLTEEDVQAGPLTLAAGFRKVLHPKEGKYVGQSDHIGDMKRYAKRIVAILGAELLWEQVKHRHYRKLWRTLAEEYSRKETYGLRQAEVIVGLLQSAARWLQAEGLIEPGDALPAPMWKQAMQKEWAAIVGAPVPEVHAPRHSVEEIAKLWAALPDPRVDPRLWLGMEIGAELRLGQVPRSRRSDVRLTPSGELYSVRVHGMGKKLGEVVVLTPEQRAVLRFHLEEGYLRELEAEYQAGRLADYYLLPGGKLRYWERSKKLDYPKAQVKNAMRSPGETALAKWWERLEEVAGVDHLDGRRWYGVRRLQSDRAEDVETDDRVLNKMGAWSNSNTRRRYQEKGRTKIQEQAAAVRRKIRPGSDLATDQRDEGE